MTLRKIFPFAAGVVAASLAGCSVAPNTPTQSSAGNASNAGGGAGNPFNGGSAPSCSSISAAEVSGTLGLSVSDPTETGSPQREQCSYQVTSGGTSSGPPVLVELVPTTLALFQGAESAYSTGITPVAGVGDAAYSIASTYVGEGQNEVAAYAKGLKVTITTFASVTQISSLIKTIYSKL